MSDLISIIVPVYKVEKYLRRCVQSIICQTYSNIEIILVDDGSPDRCGEICDEYASKDERIKVIHQKNKGVSAARNAGLDVAKGEYIAFVDSDDYVEKEYIDVLYNNIFDSDVVIAGYERLTENGSIISKNTTDKVKNIQIPDGFSMLLGNGVVWGKLMRKNIIGNIRFDTSYCVGEDGLFLHTVYRKCRQIKLIPDILYNYIQYDNSAFHGKFNKNKYTEIFALQRRYELYEDIPDMYDELKVRYICSCTRIYNNMFASGWKKTKEAEYVINEIRKNRRYINKITSRKVKLSASLSVISRPLYNLYLKIRLNIKGKS